MGIGKLRRVNKEEHMNYSGNIEELRPKEIIAPLFDIMPLIVG